MQLLALTLQYDLSKEKEFIKKSRVGLSAAANTFQNNLVKGLAANDIFFRIVHTPPFAPFPQYKQLVIPSETTTICGVSAEQIGYINLPVIKQWIRTAKYKKAVTRWIKNTEGEKCILVYSLYLPFEKVLKYVKRRFPEVKTLLICTDLPCEFGILPKNPIKAFLYNQYGKKTLSYGEYIDSYVLLTDQMKNPLKAQNKPYVVVEGIADSTAALNQTEIPSEEKILLYTGSLNHAFGIADLVDAFEKIESSNYRLWICGAGECEKHIVEAAKRDSRITFFGYVDKEKIAELQSKATVLVNPRKNEGEYTKYSFPSKTMEYMLSGKPVLMYKLDGIPDEYDDYLYYFSGTSIEQIAKGIIDVCEKPSSELKDFGQQAQAFVAEHKNACCQAKKIIELLESNEG